MRIHPDHLILTTPDLSKGMDYVENLLGIRPVFAGQHLGLGTHNALLSLGNRTYFEVIAPDPKQNFAKNKLWITIEDSPTPRLSRWVAQTDQLSTIAEIAKKHQIPLGDIRPGSRTQTDGTPISWEATFPAVEDFGGLLPFFINWGNSLHPSESLPLAGSLKKIFAVHPNPDLIKNYWRKLSIPYEVEYGSEPQLHAWINTKKGLVKLGN